MKRSQTEEAAAPYLSLKERLETARQEAIKNIASLYIKRAKQEGWAKVIGEKKCRIHRFFQNRVEPNATFVMSHANLLAFANNVHTSPEQTFLFNMNFNERLSSAITTVRGKLYCTVDPIPEGALSLDQIQVEVYVVFANDRQHEYLMGNDEVFHSFLDQVELAVQVPTKNNNVVIDNKSLTPEQTNLLRGTFFQNLLIWLTSFNDQLSEGFGPSEFVSNVILREMLGKYMK